MFTGGTAVPASAAEDVVTLAGLSEEEKLASQAAIDKVSEGAGMEQVMAALNDSQTAINNLNADSTAEDAVAAINNALSTVDTGAYTVRFELADDYNWNNAVATAYGSVQVNGRLYVEETGYEDTDASSYNVRYFTSQYIADNLKEDLEIPESVEANANGTDAVTNAKAAIESQLQGNDWYERVTGKMGSTGVFGYSITGEYQNDKVTLTLNVYKTGGTASEGSVTLDPIKVVKADNAAKAAFDQIQEKISEDGVKVSKDYEVGSITSDTTEVPDAVVKAANSYNLGTASKTYYQGRIGIELNGSKYWEGPITVTTSNGDSYTGTLKAPLEVSKSEITDIEILTDNRSTDKKELWIKTGDNVYGDEGDIDLTGVTVQFTMTDGSIYKLNGTTNGTLTGNGSDKIGVDCSAYKAGSRSVGTYPIKFYAKDDNSVSTSVDVKVIQEAVIKNSDLDTQAGLNKVTSSNNSIVKGVAKTSDEDATEVRIRMYSAGTATLTFTDAENNLIKADITVNADGTYELTPAFSTEVATFDFETLKADLPRYNLSVSVDDEEIATAKYVYNAKNDADTLQITPVHEGETWITISSGEKGNIQTKVCVRVTKTGTVNILEFAEKHNPTVSALSFDSNTLSGLKKATFFGEWGVKSGDEVTEIPDGLNLTVTAQVDGETVTDTYPLNDEDSVRVFWSKTQYGSGASELQAEFRNRNVAVNRTNPATVTMKQKVTLKNTADNFGCVVNNINIVKGDGSFSAEKIMVSGEEYIVFKALKQSDAVQADLDDGMGRAIFSGSVQSDYSFGDPKNLITKYSIKADAETNYTAPTKKEYHIGETLDVSGAEFSYKAETITNDIADITASMYLESALTNGLTTKNYKFTSIKTGSKKASATYTFNYGGVGNYGKATNGTSYAMTVTVKPVEVSINKEALGLSEDETIRSVAVNGDAGSFDVSKTTKAIKAIGYATDKNILVNVTTNTGDIIKVSVAVDSDGNITYDVNPRDVVFVPVDKIIKADELYLTPATVKSSDADVAKAVIKNGNVVITSVGEGTATITVADADGNEATIDVTVSEDGSMTTDVHGYLDKVWVQSGSDWYYYIAGEMVVSDWVSVTEADPYNNNEVGKVWYHFGSDGKMQRGWIVDETGWKIYLLDSNGRMMHSQWVNAPAQASLNRPAGLYKLTDDGAVQMNGWAKSVDNENIEWFCNAGNGLFEVDNPASWRVIG